jgi:hypothetical protein
MESHYMALAAEESRLNGGKLIEMEKTGLNYIGLKGGGMFRI